MNPLAHDCPVCKQGVVTDGHGFGYPKTLARWRRNRVRVTTAGRIGEKLAALVTRHKKMPKKKDKPMPLPKGRKRDRQGMLFT